MSGIFIVDLLSLLAIPLLVSAVCATLIAVADIIKKLNPNRGREDT